MDETTALSEAHKPSGDPYFELLDRVARRASTEIGDSCVITVLGADSVTLEPVAIHHPDPKVAESMWHLADSGHYTVGRGLAGSAAESGKPVLVPVVDRDRIVQEADPDTAHYYEHFDVTSMLIAPLIARGEVIGTIGLARMAPGGPYTEADQQSLEAIADLTAAAIYDERRRSTLGLDSLEAVFAHLAQGLLVTQPTGRILAANPAACEMLRMTELEICRAGRSGLVPRQEGLEGVLPEREARGHVRLQMTLRRGDGSLFPVDLFSVIFRTSSGEERSYVVFDDITQRLEHDRILSEQSASLARMNDELLRASRLKDEFLASVSHELRSPLTTILALTEVLDEGIYGELEVKQREALATITASGQHLLALINSLLDLSRMEAQLFELDLGEIRVDELARSVLQMMSDRASRRGLTLEVRNTSGVERIVADARRLMQILINLFDNAIKFTGPGGSIGLDIQRPAPGEIAFSVWDTGVGIDPAHQAGIFEPFRQVDHGLNRHYEGTGLGLALVSRLAELHGGSVGVESTLGAGSRFTVTLPISAAAEDEPPAAEGSSVEDEVPVPQPPPVVVVESPNPRRVLIVEDSIDQASVLGDYLAGKGHEVHLVLDSQQAREQALQFGPDIVLVDVQMPVVDGFEVTRRLRSERQLEGVVIIALTGLAMRGDEERCRKAGADDYLAKPYRLQEVLERVEASAVRR